MSAIGRKISSLRKSEGFTQEQFANEIGVSKPSLVKFEKGEVEIIPLGIAIKIAKVLGENFGQLFEIEGCQFASAEQEALIKVLQESELFLENKVKELEERLREAKNQIIDKEFIIDSLKKEKEFYKQSVIISIDTWYDDIKFKITNDINNAKTEDERILHKNRLIAQTQSRDYMLQNFIHIGFVTKEEINNYFLKIKEHYETLAKIEINKGKLD